MDANAVRIYSEVRENKDETESLLLEEFMEALVTSCDLKEEDERYVSYTEKGKVRYLLSGLDLFAGEKLQSGGLNEREDLFYGQERQ